MVDTSPTLAIKCMKFDSTYSKNWCYSRYGYGDTVVPTARYVTCNHYKCTAV